MQIQHACYIYYIDIFAFYLTQKLLFVSVFLWLYAMLPMGLDATEYYFDIVNEKHVFSEGSSH